MDEYKKKHIEEVHKWLEDNVKSYPSPKTLTLSEFDINWEKLSGSFLLILDNISTERLNFGLEDSGKVKYFLPMFHSPLGAPASYAAIDITNETECAILRALEATIPKVHGCGIDRKTRREFYFYTPVKDRVIDELEFENAKKRLTADYLISINLETLQFTFGYTE